MQAAGLMAKDQPGRRLSRVRLQPPDIRMLPKLLRPLALILSAVCGFTALAATESASPAATDFDLQGFLDAAIKSGEKRIVVPPGRYRVTPKHARHLQFKDLTDVEVIATGVEMVCTETTLAIAIESCRNFHLQGLTIDYDPLPFTEGRITALAPDKSWLEFEILDGYPDRKLEERIQIYNPATRELRRGDAGWEAIESLGSHRYRVAKHRGYHYNPQADLEEVGDILVTNQTDAPGGSAAHAIISSRCTGLKLEDITLYASNCFGFLENGCDGSTYLRCKVDRRSPESDPVKRAFPRMRSLDADAFHSTEAGKGPAIIDCTAKFQGDDCVNIHGTYDMVFAAEGTRLRVAAKGQLHLKWGDPVEFLPFQGERPPDATVVKIEPADGLTAEEKEFVSKLHMNEQIQTNLASGHASVFNVTLDHAVALPMGSLICSSLRVGNGFVVRGCDFGYNRSRGILIKASDGQVIGNRIAHSRMAAVLVAPEFWWLESASSSNVEIRDNVIDGCFGTAVEIIAPGGNGKPLAAGAHRNLAILGNKISASPWPNLQVSSTKSLRIEGNTFTPSDAIPPGARSWNWGTGTPQPVVLTDCAEVQQSQDTAKP